ncbi:unnamed protein product [Chrysoparadoxa australica]
MAPLPLWGGMSIVMMAFSAVPVTAFALLAPNGLRMVADDRPPVVIRVVGVGGAGGNAVNGMLTTTRDVGVRFIAVNTDNQALTGVAADERLAIGRGCTGGLGAGGKPEVGQAAAEESREELTQALSGADMVFVTAGMGGGTGTGAAPVVAAVAQELGCLTVAVVTTPFEFEGRKRAREALAGLERLRDHCDTLLVIANDRLLQMVPGSMSMTDAFLVADDVLRQGVIGTSEIIMRPGLINVDYADVRTVMKGAGTAHIGIGQGSGKSRAEDAAVGAICSPLLDFPLMQASRIICNIVGGAGMSLAEVNTAASVIQQNVDPDANIIVGALVDERVGEEVSVTVLATGFPAPELAPEPLQRLPPPPPPPPPHPQWQQQSEAQTPWVGGTQQEQPERRGFLGGLLGRRKRQR